MLVWGKVRFSLQRAIALGFAIIILVGTLLLMLPISSRDGRSLDFIDALFTATSATCVTGLVVRDTYTQFTPFGQAIILVMIQVGGLGFISVTMFFLLISRKKINLKERSLLMEVNNTFHIGGAVKFAKRVLIGTAIFELLGAFLLSLRFVPWLGLAKGVWFGVFHSISAFCNAGFDLLGVTEPYISLQRYSKDPLVLLVVAFLVICGGLGFIVWDDLIRHHFRTKHCVLHTKVVLAVTLVLITAGTVLFLVFENQHTLAGMPLGQKVMNAFFQAITPRTAGFNTINQADLSEGGSLFTMIYMFIGASPGSTGGGIKTTTFTVLLLASLAYVRGQHDVNIYGRRLEDGMVRRAFCSVFIYLTLLLAGVMTILLNQNLPMQDVLFEAFSAIGTVGLSTGVTQQLTTLSRFAVIVLIFGGRVGSLTLAMALSVGKAPAAVRNPQEKIAIG